MSESIDLVIYHPTKPQQDLLDILHKDKPTVSLAAFGRQTGKLLSNDELVYTQEGAMLLSDVRIGDRIYGVDGELTTVLDISPESDVTVWEVEFEDGSIIEACKDHSWGVWHKSKGYVIRTTQELSKDYLIESWKDNGTRQTFEKRYRVQLPLAVNYPSKELPIAPYELGALIGDGSLTGGMAVMTCHPDDSEIFDYFESEVRPRPSNDQSFGILGRMPAIRELGLDCTSHHKFIPSEYMYGSIEQRIELLQGLMDTDGTVGKSGKDIEYYTVSERLADDVTELACSLGLYAKKRVKKGRYLGEVHLSYRVSLRATGAFDLFKLKRKKDLVSINDNYNTHLFKRIVRIEEMDRKADMRCLTVDNKSHLFLTTGYTVTHNTYSFQWDAFTRCMNNRNHKVLWISPINDQCLKVMASIEEHFEDYPDLWDTIIKKVDRKYNNIFFQNGSVLRLRAAESGDNLRGMTQDFIYIDEAAYMKLPFIQEVLMPMIVRTGGRMAMASTFNGRNWYWNWYNDGKKEENWGSVKSILRTFLDLDDPEVYQTVMMLKKTMTEAQFAQEFLCRPVSASALFSNIENSIQKPDFKAPRYKRKFIGVDIGISQDYTVLTCIDEDYNVLDIDKFHYRDESMTHMELKERIIEFVHKHQEWLMLGYFEVNNNEILYDELCEMSEVFSTRMMDVVVSPSNKPKMVNHLIWLFEKGLISIPSREDLIAELYDFGGKQDKVTGNIRFSNQDGKHDDMVMSLAHATYCALEELDGGVIEFHSR